MSKTYEQVWTEDLRLCVLRVLDQTRGDSCNSSILISAVGTFGFRVPRDKMHTELAWLDEQGAVKTRKVESVVVATLTRRGKEHVDRATVIPGIKEPGLD